MSGQILAAPKNAALQSEESQSETRYCIQLCRKLRAWDMFEGYVTNGMVRHGNSMCSWYDGDTMQGFRYCCWNNGRCLRFKSTQPNKEIESHCTENPKNFLGNCIHCKELCYSDEAFMCLNCQAAYCKKCNEHWKATGYEKLRPPCLCIFNSEGMATPTWNADCKTWIPKKVIGHVFSRETSATLKGTTFIIIYQHVTLKHKSTSLCQLGKFNEENRACFLQHDIVKVYVKNVTPQPALFAELQKQWNAQETTYPVVMNSQIFQNPWRSDLIKKGKPDVDSLTIKNFKLTENSINTLLIPLVGRAQVDVGTTFTKVRPAKGYHILCGPRPVMMVYCNPLHAVAMKKKLASILGNLTNASYTAADSGYNVFRQSPASVDVKVLFEAWLQVANEFGCGNERVREKMKLLDIVFHGWKSNPENIIDPFLDGRVYTTCKSECSEFEVTYDVAQRYEADQSGANTEDTRMVKAAVFGIAKNIPGFSGRTWSMFGPIAGEQPMGSIMFDRTNSLETCLPKNVKRVKVYSSIVNLIKSRMTLSGVTLNKMTHKKLKYQGDKVQTFLDEIEANYIEHSKMLKSFRIEYSMNLNETNCSLQELLSQARSFEEEFLKELRDTTRLGLIALSDIGSLCRWSLERYRKKCRGANVNVYHDQIQAKDMLLSLWHTAGFHHFPLTQQKHARYLIDMSDDDDDDETGSVEKEHPSQRKKLRSSTDFDWTNANQTSPMLEALQYMSIKEFTFKNGCNMGESGFRYFYRKICPIPDNGQPCPWCYSSKKLLNNIERVNAEPPLALNRKQKETKAGDNASKKASIKPPRTLETSIFKIKKAAAKRAITTAAQRRGDSFVKEYACRSTDFLDPIDLALDVQSRLQHHIEMLSGSAIRWTTDELPHLIARLFIKSKKEKSSNQKIISEVQAKLKPVRLENDADDAGPIPSETCIFQSETSQQHVSDTIQITNIRNQFHVSTKDHQCNERRERALLGSSSNSRDSTRGNSNSEVAKIPATGANITCDSEMKSDRSIDDNQPNTGTENAGPNQSDISENKSKRHATHQRNGNERREQALIGISSDSRDSKCGTINSEAAKIHATGANKLGSPLNCDSEMTIDLSIDDIQPITGVENACLIQSDISKNKSDSSEAHDGISLQLLDIFQGMNIRDQRHMSTVDYQPNIGAGNAEHQLEERRKRVLFGSSSDSLDSNRGTSTSEMAKIYTTSANTHTYGEPKIMRGVLFSMQSKIIDNSFRLDSYIDLWTLEMPEPKRRSITIGKNNFEVSSFGESIKPFLHQATFNLLSLDTTDNWIGIHNNQSFIIHLAVAMNRCPFALHTMFARNCKRRAKENGVWTHDALEQVYPFDSHMNVVILSNESHDSPWAIQQYTSPSHGHGEQAIVLLREGMNYSWLKNADMRDMNLITSQQLCRSAACVTWESLTATSVCIEGNPNSNEATSTMKQEMWDNACAAVGLRESSTGKWETLPPGFGRDLSLQDGSLTPASFEKLLQMMQKKQINCQMVADLGSEAGHAVARFAFKPFVKQVTGIEIQFTWAAYSAIIMLQLQSASQNNNSYFADTCIIHDSFLNTENHLWGNALQKADLCICNNVNWEKGGKANPVPKEHQQLKGEFKHSIDANVAELLGEYMKRNSHIVVFNSKNFSNQRYQYLDKLEVQATWSTKEEVRLLKTNSYHFKYLIPALQALCQNNSVDFDKIPRDWFAYEGHSPSATGYVVLKNHVMKSAAWKKSNAAVHLGWRIQSDNIPQAVCMAVCIKTFPSATMERIIQKEIEILNLIARGEKTLQNNVIGFLGTDTNMGCTVLVFEMVQSSNFYTDLQSISMNKIALYTFKLLQALEFLNQKDVVHRDVKPDNFLHNFETNIFKLIDFGSSVKGTKGFQAKGGGTTGFKAPEILMGAMHQTAAVDIWSAGIIMLIMLTGDRYILSRATEKDKNWAHLKEITAIVGYEKMHEVAAYLHEAETFTSHVQDQQSRIISTNVRGWTAIVEQKRLWETDTDSLDLLSQMLDVDPRTRITARDALKHPFFNQFRK